MPCGKASEVLAKIAKHPDKKKIKTWLDLLKQAQNDTEMKRALAIVYNDNASLADPTITENDIAPEDARALLEAKDELEKGGVVPMY